MNTRVKTLAAASAIALLLAGGAVAAVTATGSRTSRGPHAGRLLRGGAGARDLATTSSYLGIPVPQLQTQLRAGESLAQIAQATPGRSAAGLVSALIAAKRARLAKAAAGLGRRVQAEVERTGGPGGGFAREALPGGIAGRLFGAPGDAGMPAASYLGISPMQLRSQLQAGKTLAQIARERNRPQAGLEGAIVAAKKQALEAAVLAGAIRQARESAVAVRLTERVHRLVNRSFE